MFCWYFFQKTNNWTMDGRLWLCGNSLVYRWIEKKCMVKIDDDVNIFLVFVHFFCFCFWLRWQRVSHVFFPKFHLTKSSQLYIQWYNEIKKKQLKIVKLTHEKKSDSVTQFNRSMINRSCSVVSSVVCLSPLNTSTTNYDFQKFSSQACAVQEPAQTCNLYFPPSLFQIQWHSVSKF